MIYMRTFKLHLVCFFLFLFSSNSYSQYFTGKVTYRQSFESKTPEITNEVLSSFMGDSHEYFYSKGSYKSVVNGIVGVTLVYKAGSDKLYSYPKTQDSLTVIDITHDHETILNYKVNKRVEKVLGEWCDELIIVTDKSPLARKLFPC